LTPPAAAAIFVDDVTLPTEPLTGWLGVCGGVKSGMLEPAAATEGMEPIEGVGLFITSAAF